MDPRDRRPRRQEGHQRRLQRHGTESPGVEAVKRPGHDNRCRSRLCAPSASDPVGPRFSPEVEPLCLSRVRCTGAAVVGRKVVENEFGRSR